MINKLKDKGSSGKFFKIIEAMLDNIIQIPKINNYLLSPIVTTLGLKQIKAVTSCSTHKIDQQETDG